MSPSTHSEFPSPRSLGEAKTSQRRALLIQEAIRETPSTSPSRSRGQFRVPRRFLVAASGLVTASALAAATLVYVQGSHAEHVLAATPVMLTYRPGPDQRSAADLLENLATATRKQVIPAPGTYQYTKIRSWSLYTSVAQGKAKSALVPSTQETWRATDGPGVSRTTSSTGTVTHGPLPIDNVKYSTDPIQLATQLAVGHPTSYGAAERITAVVDLILSHRVDPQLEAALLRVLARENGLVNQGVVTDRVGRQGVAVGVDANLGGLPTRYSLIFDPTTGALLDYEEMLTTSAGQLNVPIPSVVRYNVWAEHATTTKPGLAP